jgi:methyl-accepting chemotaxis protein
MDQVTQQNAALVEQVAAASEAMKDQARKLTKLVSIFKLNNLQQDAVDKVREGAKHAAAIPEVCSAPYILR